MTKEYLNPDDLFPSIQYGFSQIVTSPPGKLVFLSGQVAWDEAQETVGAGDLRAQTWQALRNVETAMRAAGGTLEDVVSLRIYVVQEELAQTDPIREGLQSFFAADRAPATTWIGVHSLANQDFLIEIEAVGVVGES